MLLTNSGENDTPPENRGNNLQNSATGPAQLTKHPQHWSSFIIVHSIWKLGLASPALPQSGRPSP